MELQIDHNEPFPVARVSGELGALDAGRFIDTLFDYVSGQGKKLAIELSELQSIDSSGLSALISLVTRARLGGGEVVLVAPTSFVSGVFSTARLDTWFDLCPTLDEAEQRLA